MNSATWLVERFPATNQKRRDKCLTCVIDMQSIEEVIFLCSFLKELAPFSCSLSHILMSASRFRRLTDRQLCHNVFIIETLLPASESALMSPTRNSFKRTCPGNEFLVCGTQKAYIPDLFWNLHLVCALHFTSWNYILASGDQNISDKIALKILTKPDMSAPYPFPNRTQFAGNRTSLNRHDEKL